MGRGSGFPGCTILFPDILISNTFFPIEPFFILMLMSHVTLSTPHKDPWLAEEFLCLS
jgi:hypothetical protein